MQVVVIGGGIIGLASAYFLAREGVDVVVCEKRTIGAGSTERAAGGIRSQFSTEINIELSLLSLEWWERFEETFGIDIAHRQHGYLFLARTPETARAFEGRVARQRELGVPSRVLTPAEARSHCPGLKTDPFEAATYSPTDGFADPHLALEGFKNALLDLGVPIETGTSVTDIVVERGTNRGVETTEGYREADAVVNAAGPWAGHIASMAGIDVPVTPRRRRLAVVEPVEPVPESVPMTIDLDSGFYFRPERDGAALVGGQFTEDDRPQDPDAFDTGIGLDWSMEVLEHGLDVASYFGPDAAIRDGWAGLYAVTPDHHPIIEETLPGFVNAVGFSGHGFMHAPATGQLVAELVVDGTASTLDITDLGSHRFADDVELERQVV